MSSETPSNNPPGGLQLPMPALGQGPIGGGAAIPRLRGPGSAGPGGGPGAAGMPQGLTDPLGFTESCLMKPLVMVPMGFAMGGAFGVFMGSWEGISPPVLLPGVPMPPPKPMMQEFRATGRQMGRKAKNWSKNFAIITAVFSGGECALERIRAKDDMWNSCIAGFIAGAGLSARQGPQAMLFGGAGFAVFSVIIDKITGRH